MTNGLLRVIPASEAAEVRRLHREDFQLRYYRLTGHPLSMDDAWRWWPS